MAHEGGEAAETAGDRPLAADRTGAARHIVARMRKESLIGRLGAVAVSEIARRGGENADRREPAAVLAHERDERLGPLMESPGGLDLPHGVRHPGDVAHRDRIVEMLEERFPRRLLVACPPEPFHLAGNGVGDPDDGKVLESVRQSPGFVCELVGQVWDQRAGG